MVGYIHIQLTISAIHVKPVVGSIKRDSGIEIGTILPENIRIHPNHDTRVNDIALIKTPVIIFSGNQKPKLAKTDTFYIPFNRFS